MSAAAFGRAGRAALLACVIAGCHGGGDGTDNTGGTGGQQFIVSPSNLAFSAATAGSATPQARTVTATVSGPTAGTLFARVVVTGTAVVSVDDVQILSPTQARVIVHPASPTALGIGRHSSVITLIACHTDPNCTGAQIGGSPATINVAYQVGVVTPPPPESLAPSVGAAGVAGEVVLRGSGFLPVNSVTFNATPAVEFTVMSDSEIRATYPALAAGTLTIGLNGGTVAFSQSLTLVPAGTFTSTTLPYPAAPQNMRGLAFDAVTQTLFVGAGRATPTDNQVLRYTFAGGAWTLPAVSATVPNLRNLVLSLDGTRLLALTDTTVVDLIPASLLAQATTTRIADGSTAPDSFLKGIVATNDGRAFIVSTSPTSPGPGQSWLYNVAAQTFSSPFNSYISPEIGGPDNGTRAVLVQGGLQVVQQYSAFTGSVSPTSLSLAHFHPVPGRLENINLPAFDRNGDRMLVAGFSGGTFHAVYDANFGELGRVPSGDLTATTAAYAISPDGLRAFILQIGSGICRVRAFDLTAPPGPGLQYPEVVVTGFPINLLPNCPALAFDTPIRILLDPPGDTLFIAGNQSIRVVRLP
jgi:hypothetical protein